jgi:type I restriction enzyme R subunit
VNGLPLVFVELKASHKRLENAFDRNLRDYKNTIPQLFWYNALVILSNGSKSRVGSITSEWEHFAEWKKINSEGEEGIISLETMIRGTCNPPRLLDLVENFTLFQEVKGGLHKIFAKNHQYLGVNNALQAVQKVKENQGRLGVFWPGDQVELHGLSKGAARKMPNSFTFLIVTDRDQLDDQITRTSPAWGRHKRNLIDPVVTLKQLLRDHRYVLQIRSSANGDPPTASERSDIIVITDEAHRSQYDIFAQNMRNALPGAAFIGFTGTPLMVGEEKTRQVFGDYVSVYNFKQAIDDGATVPLYYENRIPELQLVNPYLNDDLQRIIDDAADEEQEKKLERGWAVSTTSSPGTTAWNCGPGHREALLAVIFGQGPGCLHR